MTSGKRGGPEPEDVVLPAFSREIDEAFEWYAPRSPTARDGMGYGHRGHTGLHGRSCARASTVVRTFAPGMPSVVVGRVDRWAWGRLPRYVVRRRCWQGPVVVAERRSQVRRGVGASPRKVGLRGHHGSAAVSPGEWGARTRGSDVDRFGPDRASERRYRWPGDLVRANVPEIVPAGSEVALSPLSPALLEGTPREGPARYKRLGAGPSLVAQDDLVSLVARDDLVSLVTQDDHADAIVIRETNHQGRGASPMRLSAVASASAAGTLMSGSTPVPSQFVCVIGLIGRECGTLMTKFSPTGRGPTGCAPPPVTSPTIVARFCALRS